uniref:Uncharacterized protein n=1 Tax=Candidatus Kentrum sp. LFY TaxID=2126342 RepID=A0A450USN5_9GAMM|nr:MAG: hypothetical protein BECKLFY1418A_GA0070994_105113 [Candidatus Kentron sp. LFY]
MLALRARTEAGWVLAYAPILSEALFFRYLEKENQTLRKIASRGYEVLQRHLPKPFAFLAPTQQILLKSRWTVTEYLLLPLKLPRRHDLSRVDEGAHIFPGIPYQPVEGAGWYSSPDRNGQIHRKTVPIQLVQNNDDLCIVGFHPVGKWAALDDPGAIEVATGIPGSVVVIIATAACTVRTRSTGVHGDAIDNHLHPAIATSGAGSTFSVVVFVQRVDLSRRKRVNPVTSIGALVDFIRRKFRAWEKQVTLGFHYPEDKGFLPARG